jgi:hypothetical protein
MNEQPIDLDAYRIWKSWPEERRRMYLNNAFCFTCIEAGTSRVASFAPGYTVRKNGNHLVVEGRCAACGERIARSCD